MLIGYARVSTKDKGQSLDFQIDKIKEFGASLENIYTDQASGKDFNRAGWKECYEALKPGDTLVVWSLDRFGRNLPDGTKIAQELHKRNIKFLTLDSNEYVDIVTANGQTRFFIQMMLGHVNRTTISMRVTEGIKKVRAAGKYWGRRPALSPLEIINIQNMIVKEKKMHTEVAKIVNRHHNTIYNYIDKHGQFTDRAYLAFTLYGSNNMLNEAS